ncbi:pectate lyase [Aeoliella sp.]|uniref:pectate lyase n=1 Tax=Aeoliella sp. TaxID=2795800 RepID=UPI003CCC1258
MENNSLTRLTLLVVLGLLLLEGPNAAFGQARFGANLLRKEPSWYRSDEAKAIADSVLQYQSPQGGWPKSTDLARPPRSPDDIPPPGGGRANSLDNDATTVPMQFLARVAHATDDAKYRDAFLRGVDYLIAAQNPNGGWPQFWPLRRGYYSHITYNDGAMIRVLELLRDVAQGDDPYDFVDGEHREQAARAVELGINCILKTQIEQDGQLTAWCAQHDETTLEPAWARAYEPPSLSGAESVGVVRFLMSIDDPSDEVIRAVEGAVAWLRSVRMNGWRVERVRNGERRRDRRLVADPEAPSLWARFYELNTNRPLYLDRDSVFRYDFSEISYERRSGYAYHGTWAASLLERDYPRWRAKHGLANEGEVIEGGALAGQRHRVIVSTDIGGTDPDDFQSMVHLLVYADVLDLEGLVSSPYGPGRKEHIQEVIDGYEADYANLKTHSSHYPTPDALRAITKQGETKRAPYAGVRQPTEGSEWIIECARRDDPRPLHLLVWGGIEDVAQALHDAPDILPKLRVYWIGGPNKKWSPDAYQYLVDNHPKLWMIESNATYRGWFTGGNQLNDMGNEEFVSEFVDGHGALGDLFESKKPEVKMGDTPSVAWLLRGNASDPSQPSWGGSYVAAWERPLLRLTRMPTADDQMEVFGILELALPVDDVLKDAEAVLRVENQRLDGYFAPDNTVRFRFSPKSAKRYEFVLESSLQSLDGKAGAVVAYSISSETAKRPTARLPNWWTDNPAVEASEGSHVGVRTVSRWRGEFLGDFAERMQRCQSPAPARSKR